MKKTYFKPQFKTVKIHGRKLLQGTTPTQLTVSKSQTNLGPDDDFDYEGAGDEDAR
ncbi:MAG: hypothetical protein IKO86_08710 [Prevotella sp.]|nr:hypothetical protein [Prevotella sp.]